jgi:hypothetical protein
MDFKLNKSCFPAVAETNIIYISEYHEAGNKTAVVILLLLLK